MSDEERKEDERPSGSLLDQIKRFNKSSLQATETKISYSNGRQYIRANGEEREIAESANVTSSSNVVYWSNQCGFLIDLVPDLSIDEIVSRLYLSGDDAATSRQVITSTGITHIVNLTTNVPNTFEPQVVYRKFLIYDLPTQSLEHVFDEAFRFIDDSLSHNDCNKVLVHCNAGVSRSSSIVIAYLLKKNLFSTYLDAYHHVKSKRSIISPNPGFVAQLKKLENKNST